MAAEGGDIDDPHDPPEVKVYNKLIIALGRGGRWEESLSKFAEMKVTGLRPGVKAYSALISALGTGGQWEKALSTFTELKAAGLRPTVITYGALISALEKGGQWEAALSIFAELKSSGLPPNAVTFNAAIRALSLGAEPQWLRALALFDEMRSAGISPDNVTCCEVINVMLMLGRRRVAVAFFRDRRSREYATVFTRPRSAHVVLVQDGPQMPVDRLDLHGLAHSSARVAVVGWLLELKARGHSAAANTGGFIVTGRGNRSRVVGQSAVREAVLELLTAELRPPLACELPIENPGCIVAHAPGWAAWLKAVDLEAWLQGR